MSRTLINRRWYDVPDDTNKYISRTFGVLPTGNVGILSTYSRVGQYSGPETHNGVIVSFASAHNGDLTIAYESNSQDEYVAHARFTLKDPHEALYVPGGAQWGLDIRTPGVSVLQEFVGIHASDARKFFGDVHPRIVFSDRHPLIEFLTPGDRLLPQNFQGVNGKSIDLGGTFGRDTAYYFISNPQFNRSGRAILDIYGDTEPIAVVEEGNTLEFVVHQGQGHVVQKSFDGASTIRKRVSEGSRISIDPGRIFHFEADPRLVVGLFTPDFVPTDIAPATSKLVQFQVSMARLMSPVL